MNGREKFELLRLEKEICSAQLHVSIAMLNRFLIISFDGTDGYDYYVDEEITNIYDYNRLYQVKIQEMNKYSV